VYEVSYTTTVYQITENISVGECHNEFHISTTDIMGHFITTAVDFVLKEILKFYDQLSYLTAKLANFNQQEVHIIFKDLPDIEKGEGGAVEFTGMLLFTNNKFC